MPTARPKWGSVRSVPDFRCGDRLASELITDYIWSCAPNRNSTMRSSRIKRATQETLALIKILALGNREVDEGKVKPVADVVRRLRAKKNGG